MIAATCTIATLRELPDSPLFEQCADSLLASWKIQRIATVGGNIALVAARRPDDLARCRRSTPTAVVWTPDGCERRIPVADFVTGVRRNRARAGRGAARDRVPARVAAARTGVPPHRALARSAAPAPS